MYPKLPRSDEVFSYYLPCEELSSYVAYYSIQHKFFSAIAPLFVPDLGGSIIVSCGANFLDMSVWGPFDRLTVIENGPGAGILARYFIVFQPGGLSRLVYPNCNEMLNRKIPLTDISERMYRSFLRIFEKYRDVEKIIMALGEYLLTLLHKEDEFSSRRYILGLFQDFGVNMTTKRLSVETHYSPRQINRYMNIFAGLPGKSYIKIKRFNRASVLLKQSAFTVEHIAFSIGYYDASHFVHDFTEPVGLTPTLYRRSMSGFYNETLKKF
jgi:AraC-like DNA-binding protein